ncbi:MAG: xylan 1,4-beta-xylosidase [Oscillospiraceae bacterium]|nr:xylan 1,4-beta-xylosidase [Oscillospiraceae bacterium]
MADDRFVKIYSQGNGLTSSQIIIYVDKVTGVNYVFCQGGYAGGLTPLLDKDGKPVVTLVENK